MINIERGMIVDINLDPVPGSETGKVRPCIVVTNDIYNARVPVIQVVPLTAWNEKKSQIQTNVTIEPSHENGLAKKSVADCLQTRPIDYRMRLSRVRGKLEPDYINDINQALKAVFFVEVKSIQGGEVSQTGKCSGQLVSFYQNIRMEGHRI